VDINSTEHIQTNVHARAGWNFLVHKSIDVHIIHLLCEYQLIWAFNEWFMGGLVLANQTQMHVKMDNFDHIDQLSVSIFIYNINIKEIQWRAIKL
jgi:hypothetical protein